MGCCDEDDEGEEDFMIANGIWTRDLGSLELKVQFDTGAVQFTGGEAAIERFSYFQHLRAFFEARTGKVQGKVSTDPCDGTPFAVVLLMVMPDGQDGRSDCPWIFNFYETKAEADENDKTRSVGGEE